MANDNRGWMEPKFSRHLPYRWGKHRKTLNQGNWLRGFEPGPARLEATMFPLDQSGGFVWGENIIDAIILKEKYFSMIAIPIVIWKMDDL